MNAVADQSKETVLEMKQVSKSFPGTLAVDRIDFDVRAGEVHALMGENGAGKSTLMKILAGSFQDYTGEILIKGKSVLLHSPHTAKANGIAMIYQELSLALPLSVAENVLVGQLPARKGVVSWPEIRKQATEILEGVGLGHIDPSIEISELPQHEAQLIEIGKAISHHPDILVMDEPTSALTRDEVLRLYEIIHQLTDQGIAIVYISHHLHEIFDVADRVTVMRDGRKIATKNISETNPKELVEMMVGQSVESFLTKEERTPGDVLFEAEHISRWGFFHDVSFQIRSGEILGLCGLAGAGRTEMAQSIVGIDPLNEGTIRVSGEQVNTKSFLNAMKHGIAYLSENRKQFGLALRLSMQDNVHSANIHNLARGIFVPKRAGKEQLKKLGELLQIYPYDPERIVSNFSGGNQQKILLAKWLAIKPRILILDEPTRGVDIGAKTLIHNVIQQMAAEGHAILLISSDLPEVTGLADRVIIMKDGHLTGELSGKAITEENLLLAANGEEVTDGGTES